jgi:UDP-glucose 4-epimerase
MILVTGGAGYIGSHVVKKLLQQKYKVIVLDNLSTGHVEAVDKRAIFVKENLGNGKVLEKIFSSYPLTGVLHFGASCYVGESVLNPLVYYQNNVAATITLLQKMLKHGLKNIVFSSTCAVYGTPAVKFIDEKTETKPINPYGKSKLMVEQIIADFSKAYGLQYIVLRYFNAAGSGLSGEIGEDHSPETHLIPIILKHLLGQMDKVVIYGHDYQTDDRTCVRDFIHVHDLANAHLLALEQLLKNQTKNEIFNLGHQKGYSVQEIVKTCEKITGKKAIVEFAGRREGDPPRLVACTKKAQSILNWKPAYSIEKIIESAWEWHRNHPHGYQK